MKSFTSWRTVIDIFAHCGALEEAGDVTVCFRIDLIRSIVLEQKVHHVSVRLQHFWSSEIHCRRDFRE